MSNQSASNTHKNDPRKERESKRSRGQVIGSYMNYRDMRTIDTDESAIDLSATMEALLADQVAAQQQADAAKLQQAHHCAIEWNTAYAAIGSFADEYSTF